MSRVCPGSPRCLFTGSHATDHYEVHTGFLLRCRGIPHPSYARSSPEAARRRSSQHSSTRWTSLRRDVSSSLIVSSRRSRSPASSHKRVEAASWRCGHRASRLRSHASSCTRAAPRACTRSLGISLRAIASRRSCSASQPRRRRASLAQLEPTLLTWSRSGSLTRQRDTRAGCCRRCAPLHARRALSRACCCAAAAPPRREALP